MKAEKSSQAITPDLLLSQFGEALGVSNPRLLWKGSICHPPTARGQNPNSTQGGGCPGNAAGSVLAALRPPQTILAT